MENRVLTEEMKKEGWTIVVPNMSPIHFNIMKRIFLNHGFNALLLESVLLQSAFMLHLPSLRKASACVLPMAPVPIIAIPCISAS